MKAAAILALLLRLNPAPGASLDHLAITYQLGGAFGSVGGFIRTRPDATTYSIPLAYEGLAADSVKAIIYSPSSRFVLIEGSRSSTNEAMTLTLEPQKTVTIAGTIASSIGGEGLIVEATYVAPWAMSFLGYLDGPVPTFVIGSVPLEPDGSFSITLPRLSEDPVVSRRDEDGAPSHFELIVRDVKTWNIRGHLKLESGQRLLARDPLPAKIRCVLH